MVVWQTFSADEERNVKSEETIFPESKLGSGGWSEWESQAEERDKELVLLQGWQCLLEARLMVILINHNRARWCYEADTLGLRTHVFRTPFEQVAKRILYVCQWVSNCAELHQVLLFLLCIETYFSLLSSLAPLPLLSLTRTLHLCRYKNKTK